MFRLVLRSVVASICLAAPMTYAMAHGDEPSSRAFGDSAIGTMRTAASGSDESPTGASGLDRQVQSDASAQALPARDAAFEAPVHFEYPRVAKRQVRAPQRRPGSVRTNSCRSCWCGFLCNDFGYCNAATGGSCQEIGPPFCAECTGYCSCIP